MNWILTIHPAYQAQLLLKKKQTKYKQHVNTTILFSL